PPRAGDVGEGDAHGYEPALRPRRHARPRRDGEEEGREREPGAEGVDGLGQRVAVRQPERGEEGRADDAEDAERSELRRERAARAGPRTVAPRGGWRKGL